MTTIRHEVRANCSPDRVWALLANLEAVAEYNPGVERAAIEGDQRTGVGARRVCALRPKGRVIERVTHWEEKKALGLEVAESDWPIHYMRWITKLEHDDGATRITQELEYQVKFGPVGWVLDRLMMERKLRSTLDGVLAALVAKAETA